jgi:hypothetical protein
MVKIWIGMIAAVPGLLALGEYQPFFDPTRPIIAIVVIGFITVLHAIGGPCCRNANPENAADVDFPAVDYLRSIGDSGDQPH